MPKTLLLTSFTTWMPHQRSNSSDDLLLKILEMNLSPSLHFLRQLPVDFELAPQQAIAQIKQLQPKAVICCGMAEKRTMLTVESRAVAEEVLHTPIDLDSLIAGLPYTKISHDAGRFVCNCLYYALLKHFQSCQTSCIFVHVPILTADNLEAIAADFSCIIDRMLQLEQKSLFAEKHR